MIYIYTYVYICIHPFIVNSIAMAVAPLKAILVLASSMPMLRSTDKDTDHHHFQSLGQLYPAARLKMWGFDFRCAAGLSPIYGDYGVLLSIIDIGTLIGQSVITNGIGLFFMAHSCFAEKVSKL